MSIEIHGAPGRFCNHVIRNSFASMLASQFNLTVNYSYQEEIERLGIPLYNGSGMLQTPSIPAVDIEVLDTIEGLKQLQANVYNFCNDNCYFQSRRHTIWLRKWLCDNKTTICAANPFKERMQNSDIFVHLRLGDAAAYTPGIEYFRKAITTASESGVITGYISTDSPDHPLTRQLLIEFPTMQLFTEPDIVRVIQFASTCARVVLSHGSFSAVIGFLAFDSNVYYAPYTTIWCGDMFTQPDWHLIA